MALAGAEGRLRATGSAGVAAASDDEEDSIIQDNLQSEVIASYYDGVNERKRRASVEMEETFTNELEMFRRQDAALVVQCGWRSRIARADSARKRACLKVAEAGTFLGHLMLHYFRMKEHREAFLLHKRQVAAALILQKHTLRCIARKKYNLHLNAKRAREREMARRKLLEEAEGAVNALNNQYSKVNLEQIAVAKDQGAAAETGVRDTNGSPTTEAESEPAVDDAREPFSPAPADEGLGKLTPTPPTPAIRRRRKGGRSAGLCTGRARQRAGSVEASMAFEGVPEGQRHSLVVRSSAFRAAGQKIQSMIAVSNVFASGLAQPDAGPEAEAEKGAAKAEPKARAQPPKKGRKARATKSSARNYAKTKPRYLQHLEPKPPGSCGTPALARSGRLPGSAGDKLPPLPKTAREAGQARPPAASARVSRTSRGYPQQLTPLRVRAR